MTFIKTYAVLIALNVLIIYVHLHRGRRRSRWYVNAQGQLITSKLTNMTPAQIDYNWLLNIIDSSNNDFHFSCVDKLIDLFYEKHNNESFKDLLIEARYRHWNLIHSILK